MANAQRPTKHTRHIDIKQFAQQDWVMEDLIALKRIKTSDNCADVLTKATGTSTIFHRHMDLIMGKVIPEYAKHMVNNLTYSVSRLTHDYTGTTNSKEYESGICIAASLNVYAILLVMAGKVRPNISIRLFL